MTHTARVSLYVLHAVALVVVVCTVVRYINSPLRFDETDWPPEVGGILMHGVPRLTLEEDRRLDWPRPAPAGMHYGMWHPPLYEYTLAAARRIAGDHNWTYRSVGVVCLLLTVLIAWRIVADLLPHAPPLLCAMPISLALLSPLVTDVSLFLDIDNTVLAPIMLFILWRFLRARDVAAPRTVLVLSLLMTLALTAKLTTPVVLWGSLGLYALLGSDRWRRVAAVAAIGLISAALFTVAYWAYCRAFSYPPEFMAAATYGSKRSLYTSVKSLAAILFAVRWHIVWLSPLLTVLFASVTWTRLQRYWRVRQPEPIDLLVIFAAAVFGVYALVGAMWGKYAMPGAFVAVLVIGIALAPGWAAMRVARARGLVLSIAVVMLGAAWLVVPYVRLPNYGVHAATIWGAVLDPRNVSAAVSVLVALTVGVSARWWLSAPTRRAGAALAIAMCFVATSVVVTGRVLSPRDDRGPLRPISDRGFTATVAYLNRTAPDGAVILALKDLGYYYRGGYYPLEWLVGHYGDDGVRRVAARPDVAMVVDSATYPTVDPSVYADPAAHVEVIGDYRVYVKRYVAR